MRALLSVSDKRGLVPFARGLCGLGWEIVSTGGTAEALRKEQVPVIAIEQVTGFPEMMDGRVKTLHPKVHGGLLARRSHPGDRAALAQLDTLLRVARTRGVALQYGTTNGGNDGSMFTPYGVVDVALGWPLRYSHSPAEVIDLKDVASLADLVRAIAETW